MFFQKWDQSGNVWETLARNITNATTFCLAGGTSVGEVFNSCLLEIPTPLLLLKKQTILRFFDVSTIYSGMYSWGKSTKVREKGMLRVKVKSMSPAESCIQFVNCTSRLKCENLSKFEHLFKCNRTAIMSS